MVRLFCAIDATPSCSLIRDVQLKLLEDGLKPTDHFHITLKFLGDVKEEDIPLIHKQLKQVEFFPFLTLSNKIIQFPEGTHPKVLALNVVPFEILNNFQKQIEFYLKDYFEAVKNYIPHITLARVKFINDKEQLINKIENTKFEPVGLNINSFYLYKSELKKEGPVYTVLHKYDPIRKA